MKKTLGMLVRESGLDPDKVIVWDALAEPHRTIVSQDDMEDRQIKALSTALRESMKLEIKKELSWVPENSLPVEWARRDSNSGSPPFL